MTAEFPPRFCDRVDRLTGKSAMIPPMAIPNMIIAPVIVFLRCQARCALCTAKRPSVGHIGHQMWQLRSLIIQVKCGTFAATECLSAVLLHEKGEAMRKTLMALAAVATLAVSAVAARACPCATGSRRRHRRRADRRRHRRRRDCIAERLLRPGLLWSGLWLLWSGRPTAYYAGPAYVADPGYGGPASGSGSGSGMALAGGFAASGFATEPVHLH